VTEGSTDIALDMALTVCYIAVADLAMSSIPKQAMESTTGEYHV